MKTAEDVMEPRQPWITTLCFCSLRDAQGQLILGTQSHTVRTSSEEREW